MKCLSLIINESSKSDIVEMMRNLPEVTAYTMFHGEGHYSGGIQPFESPNDEVLGYVPRIRIDLFLKDDDVEKVIASFRSCSPCSSKRGLFWVSSMDSIGNL